MEREQLLNLGFTPEEISDIQLNYVDESLNVYNQVYGTTYTLNTLPPFLIAYIALNTLMTLNGWRPEYAQRFPPETLQIMQEIYGDQYRQYGGIQATNAKILQEDEGSVARSINNMTPEDKERFIDIRTAVLVSGLIGIYQLIHRELSKLDNRNIIGVITRNDGRVRPEHQPNHMRYWTRGSRRDFSHDYNCRCTYLYFRSEEEANQNGFRPFT